MLRSPHLSQVVSLAALFCYPYYFQFDCQRYTEENKTYRLCVPMQTQQKKTSKTKGSDVFKETTMTCHHQHVCTIMFESFVRNQQVFLTTVTHFVFSSKNVLFFWLAKILLRARLGSKTQQSMASLCQTLARLSDCYTSSALWFKHVLIQHAGPTVYINHSTFVLKPCFLLLFCDVQPP